MFEWWASGNPLIDGECYSWPSSTPSVISQPIDRRTHMTEKSSGPQEAVRGVVEDVKGKTKEAIGTVTGDDDLIEEGKAQQDKAEAQREAAHKEAEAEKSRAEAKSDEKRQKAHE
jgi:uncharacterized protein YjbJ (UPF0337 family)